MSDAREVPAPEWLDQHMGTILAFSIRAGAVAYQGARIADAEDQLRAGSPRDIALAQLHEELRDEYTAMLHARQALPSQEELQEHADAAHTALAEAKREESALHLIVATEVHQVQAEVELAAEHVPAAEQQLMAYMREQIARLIGTRGEEQTWRQYNAAEIVERYAGALAMMDYVPVPEALSAEERAEIEAQAAASAQLAAPQPELPLDVHALAAAVKAANPEAEGQGLNTLAALLLLQDPSRRLTAAEIGSVLYPRDDPAKATNKAGALLHHSLEGRTGGAGRILAENGYRLVKEAADAGGQTGEGAARQALVYRVEVVNS